MNNKKFIYIIFIFFLSYSCSEEPQTPHVSFEWVVSEYTSYGSNLYSFITGDDDRLYSMGFHQGQYGVYQENRGTWTVIAKLEWPGISIQKFTVYKGSVYVVGENALWKADLSATEKIDVGGQVTDVTQFNGKLVIAGKFNDVSGNSYGVAYTEDTNTFIFTTPEGGEAFPAPAYNITTFNNKLFIRGSGNHLYEYDGEALTKIEFNLGFDVIDSRGSFYAAGGSVNKQEIDKWENGTWKKVGPSMSKGITINKLFFKDDILIALGIDSTSGISTALYLFDNKWEPIATTNYFFGAFKYKDRILAYTIDGVIAELNYN